MDQETAPAIREDVKLVGEIGLLFAALAKAQGSFATIVKDSTAKVQGKDGKPGYDFDYAGLDVVLAAVRPALSANGLAVAQVFTGSGQDADLLTILAHESGGRIEVRCMLPACGRIQELGSALTYMKRYQLLGLLGVAPSDDDDGNAADKNQAAIKPRERQQPPAAKQAPKTSDLAPGTRSKIVELAKGAGFQKVDLEAFIAQHELGTGLDTLTEFNGAKLVVELEKLRVQP